MDVFWYNGTMEIKTPSPKSSSLHNAKEVLKREGYIISSKIKTFHPNRSDFLNELFFRHNNQKFKTIRVKLKI